MENGHEPKWDGAAEEMMRALGRATDPAQMRTYDETIRITEQEDETGETSFVAVDGESPADGTEVSGAFNPNNN